LSLPWRDITVKCPNFLPIKLMTFPLGCLSFSFFKHPQDFVLPARKDAAATSQVFPH